MNALLHRRSVHRFIPCPLRFTVIFWSEHCLGSARDALPLQALSASAAATCARSPASGGRSTTPTPCSRAPTSGPAPATSPPVPSAAATPPATLATTGRSAPSATPATSPSRRAVREFAPGPPAHGRDPGPGVSSGIAAIVALMRPCGLVFADTLPSGGGLSKGCLQNCTTLFSSSVDLFNPLSADRICTNLHRTSGPAMIWP